MFIARFINRKVHGFTLPELVVSMLLTVLLFGFMMTAYMIFSKQLRRQFSSHFDLSGYLAVKQLLTRDFEKALLVYPGASSQTIIMRVPTAEGITEKIVYTFHTEYILRNRNARTDTLRPGATVAGQTPVNQDQPLIKALSLNYICQGKTFGIHLSKTYAITDLLRFQSE